MEEHICLNKDKVQIYNTYVMSILTIVRRGNPTRPHAGSLILSTGDICGYA